MENNMNYIQNNINSNQNIMNMQIVNNNQSENNLNIGNNNSNQNYKLNDLFQTNKKEEELNMILNQCKYFIKSKAFLKNTYNIK